MRRPRRLVLVTGAATAVLALGVAVLVLGVARAGDAGPAPAREWFAERGVETPQPRPLDPSAAALPVDVPPPPQPSVFESRLEANRRVIESMPEDAKRQMSDTVVAFRTIRDVHDATVVVMLYHLPTGSEVMLDATGLKVRRAIEGAVAREALEAALGDAQLHEIVRALTR